MSDKLNDFMKRVQPAVNNPEVPLKLPPRKRWMVGLAATGAVATCALVLTLKQPEFDSYSEVEEAIEMNFDDEVEFQDFSELE